MSNNIKNVSKILFLKYYKNANLPCTSSAHDIIGRVPAFATSAKLILALNASIDPALPLHGGE